VCFFCIHICYLSDINVPFLANCESLERNYAMRVRDGVFKKREKKNAPRGGSFSEHLANRRKKHGGQAY